MKDCTYRSRLTMVNVQSVPNTPPLNKFGGNFENGWESFFNDLDMHLSQMQSVQKFEGVYVSRNGRIVVATGSVGGTPVDLSVRPVNAFVSGNINVDEYGKVSSVDGTETAFSVTFIAR